MDSNFISIQYDDAPYLTIGGMFSSFRNESVGMLPDRAARDVT